MNSAFAIATRREYVHVPKALITFAGQALGSTPAEPAPRPQGVLWASMLATVALANTAFMPAELMGQQ